MVDLNPRWAGDSKESLCTSIKNLIERIRFFPEVKDLEKHVRALEKIEKSIRTSTTRLEGTSNG